MLLALVALAFATTTVASAPASTAHTAAVVVTKRVSKPGTYRVTITITASAKRIDRVRLLVGSVARDAIAAGITTISVEVHVAGHTLTVRASGHRRRPRIAVTLRRIPSSARSHHGTPAAPTAPVVSPPATAGASPAGDPGNWRLVFDDEFGGTSLNTAKWSAGWFGSGITQPLTPAELECFDPAEVSVGGGALNLSMIAKSETCGRKTRPYGSGIVTTNGKFSFTYGFMEARVWVPGTGGIIPDWPDVWLDGQNWPADGEIDIMEGLSGQACWHFHYPGGQPGNCSSDSFTGGWHTFGADWEPGSITYYYDGAAVGRITSGVTGARMYIILSLAADHVNGGPVQPATFRFDYVHVWQH
jgi:Glycosyl hydrolases family 16